MLAGGGKHLPELHWVHTASAHGASPGSQAKWGRLAHKPLLVQVGHTPFSSSVHRVVLCSGNTGK